MAKKSNYSVHHIIPTAAGGPNIPENKILIKDKTHVNRHRIFSNAASPAQQLMQVLTFNKKIWNDEFVKALVKVLEDYLWNYYKIEVKVQQEL